MRASMGTLVVRASAFALIGLLAGALVCLGVACSTQSGEQKPDASHPTSGAPESNSAAPTSDATIDPTAVAKSEPTGVGSADSVREPPDGGVVMNNAQTSADAGSSDRLEGIKTVVIANRAKFRTCFDAWAKGNPAGKEVEVLLQFTLAPDGTFVSGAFDPAKTQLVDKTAEECMVAAAKSLTYPASPKGMETTYRHPFVFKSNK